MHLLKILWFQYGMRSLKRDLFWICLLFSWISFQPSAEAVEFGFNPDSTTVEVGSLDTIYVDIQHDDLWLYRLDIQFDPQYLRCVALLDYGLIDGQPGGCTYNNETGLINVQQVRLGLEGRPVHGHLIKMIFQFIGIGETEIEILPSTILRAGGAVPIPYQTSYARIIALPGEGPVLNLSNISFDEDENSILILDDHVEDTDHADSLLIWTLSEMSEIQITIEERTLSFTSPENWSGQDMLIFHVIDPTGYWDEDTVQVEVMAVNDPPVVAGIPNITFMEDSLSSVIDLALYVTDVDDSITNILWSYATTDTSLIVNIISGNIAQVEALENYNGTDIPLSFIATDLHDSSDSQTISVTITPLCDPITPFSRQFPEDGSFVRRDSVIFSWTPAFDIDDNPIIYTLTVDLPDTALIFTTEDTIVTINFLAYDFSDDTLRVQWSLKALDCDSIATARNGEGNLILKMSYDVNNDMQFDLFDVQKMVGRIGDGNYYRRYDFDANGIIDFNDAHKILQYWKRTHRQ